MLIITMSVNKSVRFSLEDNRVVKMTTWSFAYREARKRHWENVAVDRFRFSRRIQQSAGVLDAILDSNHRMIVEINSYMLYFVFY